MLPAHKRLSSKQVEQLFAHNKRVRGQYMQLLFQAEESTQAAAVVGKKIVSSAVARNYHRRRIYHALRNHWAGIPHGLHLVVMMSQTGVHASFEELQEELGDLIAQLPRA